jgi:hypothetical protein
MFKARCPLSKYHREVVRHNRLPLTVQQQAAHVKRSSVPSRAASYWRQQNDQKTLAALPASLQLRVRHAQT